MIFYFFKSFLLLFFVLNPTWVSSNASDNFTDTESGCETALCFYDVFSFLSYSCHAVCNLVSCVMNGSSLNFSHKLVYCFSFSFRSIVRTFRINSDDEWKSAFKSFRAASLLWEQLRNRRMSRELSLFLSLRKIQEEKILLPFKRMKNWMNFFLFFFILFSAESSSIRTKKK